MGFVSSGITADSTRGDESKEPCCRNQDADITRLHKNADRFYSEFRPKDAVGELQKILRIESRNFEALVKLARAYVDIGDLIPENGSDWRETKGEGVCRRRGLCAPRR